MAHLLTTKFHNSNSTETVTSTNDAKSILIVKGINFSVTFSYLFFIEFQVKGHTTQRNKEEEEIKDFIYGNDQYLKRFTVKYHYVA